MSHLNQLNGKVIRALTKKNKDNVLSKANKQKGRNAIACASLPFT